MINDPVHTISEKFDLGIELSDTGVYWGSMTIYVQI